MRRSRFRNSVIRMKRGAAVSATLYSLAVFSLGPTMANAAGFESGRTLTPLKVEYEKSLSGDPDADVLQAARYSAYVAASYDALIALGMICGNGAAKEDIVATVTEYLNTNGDKIDSPAFELAFLALTQSFQCEAGSGGFNREHAPGFIESGQSLAGPSQEFAKSRKDSGAEDQVMGASFEGYVRGAHDALSIAGIVCSNDASSQELADLVANYLRVAPEKEADPGFSIITDALIEAQLLCQR